MRKTISVGILIIALVVAIPIGAFLTARNAAVDVCGTDGASQPLTGPAPRVRGLGSAQVRLAQIIWSRAHRHAEKLDGKPDQAAVIAIAVASQESTLGTHPAISRPNGDGDAGPFQQRAKPGWYGTLAQVTDRSTQPTRSCSATLSQLPSTPPPVLRVVSQLDLSATTSQA
jgi:hypothetical protein